MKQILNEYSTGTVTGNSIDFIDPDPSCICIADIATALAHQCRFTGQLEQFYSVADHSLNCALWVFKKTGDPVIALQALLHDAAEAYMGDCPSPLKQFFPQFYDIENVLLSVIFEKFDIGHPAEMDVIVKEADRLFLVAERNQFQPDHPDWPEKWDVPPGTPLPELSQYDDPKNTFLYWTKYFQNLMESPNYES